MKTITKTIELLEISDLEKDDKLMEMVCDKQRDINVDWEGWYGGVYSDHKEKLLQLGFSDVEISFSGFYSQGDGASFTCSEMDLAKVLSNIDNDLKTLIEKDDDVYNGLNELCMVIKRSNNHYVHENSCGAYVQNGGLLDDVFEKLETVLCEQEYSYMDSYLEDLVDGYIVDLNRELYKDLENEYNRLQTNERVFETLRANDYTFDLEGNIAS